MEKNGRFRKKMGAGGVKKAHALHLQQRTNMMTDVTPRERFVCWSDGFCSWECRIKGVGIPKCYYL